VRIAVPWNLHIGDKSAIGDQAILYSLGSILISENVTVSQNAHLCAGTHDFRRSDLPLLKPPIVIGPGVWICADAFVGPGVTIGAMAVVGARAVVVMDVASDDVVVGNPARVVGKRLQQARL
jgi:putative colanic acid biosynthesis acetyltransferase WcaF